jgi:hypothetical protein
MGISTVPSFPACNNIQQDIKVVSMDRGSRIQLDTAFGAMLHYQGIGFPQALFLSCKHFDTLLSALSAL